MVLARCSGGRSHEADLGVCTVPAAPVGAGGVLDAALPDPRSRSEVRGVTHLDLGWYASDGLAALVETMEYWEDLRSIQVGGLTDMDGALLTRLAGRAPSRGSSRWTW